MIIVLSDRDIPATVSEQSAKVDEEWRELEQAYMYLVFIRGQFGNLDHVAEEAFDLMEALVRWLRKKGIDIEKANYRHLEKMMRRERESKVQEDKDEQIPQQESDH